MTVRQFCQKDAVKAVMAGSRREVKLAKAAGLFNQPGPALDAVLVVWAARQGYNSELSSHQATAVLSCLVDILADILDEADRQGLLV